MAVVGNAIGRITCVIHQDFLSDQEQSTSCDETVRIERPIRPAVLHQIDRGQIASGVVQEHVFGTWIACVDATAVGARMPFVDGRIVLNARVTAVPSAFRHAVENVFGLVRRWVHITFVTDPARLPDLVFGNRVHKLVRQTDGQVCVLEHDR